MSHKKQYSEPKIYTCKGDLSRSWHVNYSFRITITGKLDRKTLIYSGASAHTYKELRIELLVEGSRLLDIKALKETCKKHKYGDTFLNIIDSSKELMEV